MADVYEYPSNRRDRAEHVVLFQGALLNWVTKFSYPAPPINSGLLGTVHVTTKQYEDDER